MAEFFGDSLEGVGATLDQMRRPPQETGGRPSASQQADALLDGEQPPADPTPRQYFNMPAPEQAEAAPAEVPGLDALPELEVVAPDSAAEEQVQSSEPPRANPTLPDPGKLRELFRAAVGTPFDPKSSKDHAYMRRIKAALTANPEFAALNPQQFAVKLYGLDD